MAKKDEQILVFPASLLNELGYFSGFQEQGAEDYLKRIMEAKEFRSRFSVEKDPSFKQLIPYVLMAHDNTVFRYTRGKKGSEERLRRLYSMGIGGHISNDDTNLFDPTYETALQREVDEEVEIGCKYNQRLVGMINDDSNSVGQVHFGMVHVFELEEPNVTKSESIITETGFVPVANLRKDWDRYETWSQLCIDYLQKCVGVSGE